MRQYDYRQAVLDDIREYIKDADMSDYSDRDEAYEALYDTLWTEDSVTGNGSGSYTFSAWKAEENLCHNLDLLKEAMDEFCCDTSLLYEGPEVLDVTIRCYLLGRCLSEALDEVWGS